MELQAISKQPAIMLEEVRFGDKQLCLCCRGATELVHRFDAPPKGETHFGGPDHSSYRRELRRCVICGHFLAVSHAPLRELYTGQYVNATYREEAIKNGPDRQEFFIVHLHIFSRAWPAMMIDGASSAWFFVIERVSAGYHPRLLRLKPSSHPSMS